jgi:uncharacterized membrane protein YqjE
MKFEVRNFLIIALVGIVTVTIISLFLSQFLDLETIKSGKAFLILFISVFLSVVWWAGHDKKLEKSELITLVFVALALVGAFWALHKFVPEIFSILPDSTKQLFSSIN